MNRIVREEKEFLLTVIGANPALRTVVVSLCKLYRYRDRSYRVVGRDNYEKVDIVIIDADDTDALVEWYDANDVGGAGPGKPAILIGAEFSEPVEVVNGRGYIATIVNHGKHSPPPVPIAAASSSTTSARALSAARQHCKPSSPQPRCTVSTEIRPGANTRWRS